MITVILRINVNKLDNQRRIEIKELFFLRRQHVKG